MRAWRIVKDRYADSAFTGEGAALVGGRWNSRGSRVVYASASQSLAALEILVHLNPRMHFHYQAFELKIDPSTVQLIEPASLPEDWQDYPAPPSTRQIGDDWLRSGKSAILQLPSVIVPTESDFLLNPTHPDFSKIKVSDPVSFRFDHRLLD